METHTLLAAKPRSHLPDASEIENTAFREYHRQHPEVYEKFKTTSFETKHRGFKRFSARGVFQIMRWFKGGSIKLDGYKLNNNYTPYYVRLLEQEHPEFIGFFEKRKTKFDTQNTFK